MSANIKRTLLVMVALIPIVILLILIIVRLTEGNIPEESVSETDDITVSYVSETIGELMVNGV